MSQTELQRIGSQLETNGHALTSFQALGVPFDREEVDKVNTLIDQSEGSEQALAVIEHIDRQGLTVVQDERCLQAARRILRPAIEILFTGSQDVNTDEDWSLFGINRYLAGGNFGAHVDKVGKSVVVATFKGERVFDICEKFEDESASDGYSFGRVTDSFHVGVGSLIILDRDTDPGHAVSSVISDSIVAVTDVDGVIRN